MSWNRYIGKKNNISFKAFKIEILVLYDILKYMEILMEH